MRRWLADRAARSQAKDGQIEILNQMIGANEKELGRKDEKIAELEGVLRPPKRCWHT